MLVKYLDWPLSSTLKSKSWWPVSISVWICFQRSNCYIHHYATMIVGEWQQREEYYNTKRRDKGDSAAKGRGCFPAHPSVLRAEQQPVIKAAIHLCLSEELTSVRRSRCFCLCVWMSFCLVHSYIYCTCPSIILLETDGQRTGAMANTWRLYCTLFLVDTLI